MEEYFEIELQVPLTKNRTVVESLPSKAVLFKRRETLERCQMIEEQTRISPNILSSETCWSLIFFPHYSDNADGSQFTLIAQQKHKICYLGSIDHI